ncbi:MAG: hypothetical protein JW763_09910 [candidate division Zixibacteria bacterium]|nr:hypothetical protein [candidate division Zixibacteria bacterium]
MYRLIPFRHLLLVIGLTVVIGLTGSAALAQQTITRTYTIDAPGEMMMINEFGGMIILKDSAVTVEMIMPPGNRPDQYKDFDFLAGDVIVMANGSKITSVEMLQDVYDKTPVGEMIKLAISRDGKMMMRKFAKADPESMPKPVVMTRTNPGGGGGADLALAGVGILLSAKDGKLSVGSLVNAIMPKFDGATPQTGDVILKVQGEDYDSPEAFAEIFGKIKTGETVTLVLGRNSEELTTSFARPNPKEVEIYKQ